MTFFTATIIILLSTSLAGNAQKSGTLLDPRDGHVYPTIEIAGYTWMAENLAYKPAEGYYLDYNGDEEKISKYGLLYKLEVAENVCPEGWHYAKWGEFALLVREFDKSLGKAFVSYEMRSEHSYQYLIEGGTSGFNVVLGGGYYVGSMSGVEYSGFYWIQDKKNTVIVFDKIDQKVYLTKFGKRTFNSIRCVKDY